MKHERDNEDCMTLDDLVRSGEWNPTNICRICWLQPDSKWNQSWAVLAFCTPWLAGGLGLGCDRFRCSRRRSAVPGTTVGR